MCAKNERRPERSARCGSAFDADDGVDLAHVVELRDLFHRAAHGQFARFVRDEDDGDVFDVFALLHEIDDADVVVREDARDFGKDADAVAHGATGKGNDQCRFEISYAALAPDLQIISPWRIDEFREKFPGRSEMIAYCREHNINVEASAKKPYSMDRNMLHISYEAGILEDPWFDPTVPENKDMFKTTVSPEDAPDKPVYLELTFEKGDCVAIDGKQMKPSDILRTLNKIGGENGIGRVDIVENRFVGMKSRGVYETPGGTILEFAHRNMETITMDRELMHLRDSLIPKYAELIYNGFWYAPEREALQAFIDKSQDTVSGVVRIKLYKGNITCVGRKSPLSLYDANIASMEGVKSEYNQDDATGFIKLQSLRLRQRARKQGVSKEAFANKSKLVRE